MAYSFSDASSGLQSISCQVDDIDVPCDLSAARLDANAKEEGEHVAVATVVDRADLRTVLKWRWIRDATPANVEIMDEYPPAKVVESMSTPVRAVATESNCTFEWSLLPIDSSGSSCASPLPVWKRDKTSGGKLPETLQVTAWGMYELAVRAIDRAGNVPTSHETRRVVFVPPDNFIALNKPKITAFNKSSHDVSMVHVAWEYKGNPAHPDPTGFEVRIGNDRQFVTGVVFIARGAAARDIVLPTNVTLWESELVTYLQVRTFYNNPSTKTKSTSEWSAVTDPWQTADKCKYDEEYLDVYPLSLSEWGCVRCPEGGWCTGSTVWYDVAPLLGWWRVPWSTNGVENGTEFVQCPYTNDCLGYDNNNVVEAVKAAPSRNKTEEGCKEGTLGVLCSTCKLNYNREGQSCVECTNEDFTVRLIVLLLIVMLMVAILFSIRKQLTKKWKRYRPLYRDVLRIATINVTFAQINSSLPSVIEVEWPLSFVMFVDHFSFVNIDIMSLIGINCVGQFDFILSFTIMTMLPVSIIVLAAAEFIVVSSTMSSRLQHMSEAKKKEKEREALHMLFNIADSDHSGVIDPEEVASVLRQLGWKVDVKVAIELAEKLDAKSDSKGTLLLTESQFVHAMATGKMARLMSKKNIRRRGRSVMMKSRNGKNLVKVQEESTNKEGVDMGAEQSSLGSRNKLVQWTLRHVELSNTLRGAMQLLLLAHTPVSRKVFQYFHYNNIGSRLFVRADYSLVAWSPKFVEFLPFVVTVMFVFTVALPTTISFSLWRYRKDLYSTSVYQRMGWLYDSYVRGAEFWQVHDVLMKMILTGMLIYIPNSSRAAIASLLCTIACCNLNYFRPHKNKVLFWLTQISFLVTTFKYIAAMILVTEKAYSRDGATTDHSETIGVLLICLDVTFLASSLLAVPMVFYILRSKLKAQNKAAKKLALDRSLSKVTPTGNQLDDGDSDGSKLLKWK